MSRAALAAVGRAKAGSDDPSARKRREAAAAGAFPVFAAKPVAESAHLRLPAQVIQVPMLGSAAEKVMLQPGSQAAAAASAAAVKITAGREPESPQPANGNISVTDQRQPQAVRASLYRNGGD